MPPKKVTPTKPYSKPTAKPVGGKSVKAGTSVKKPAAKPTGKIFACVSKV